MAAGIEFAPHVETPGCENVMHDEIDCMTAGVPFTEWCCPCAVARVEEITAWSRTPAARMYFEGRRAILMS